MKRAWAVLTALASVCAMAQSTAGLTAAEQRWLQAGLPVLTFARQQGLPVDVVVQPQPTAGQAPMAMDYVDGRCKLVLSMRGNPAAAAALAAAPAELHGVVMEAIAAHEVAHCWRHARGRWNVLPAGFVDASLPGDAATTGTAWRAMQARRREEAYADLASLAWTLQRHSAHYSQVHDWFVRVRDHQPTPGSHHDTRAWLRLAVDPAVFDPAADPFEQVHGLWQEGLQSP
jgi:hypothetical protein